MPKLLLPKFLTKSVALEAMRCTAMAAVATGKLKRETFHVVMIVPAMLYDSKKYPNCPIVPHLLAEYTHGDKSTWERDYANIAQCKALQAWHERYDNGTDSIAHLLISGDTPYWGSIKRNGIATGTSGVQSWYDRMISGTSIDMSIAFAHAAKIKWLEENPNRDFT